MTHRVISRHHAGVIARSAFAEARQALAVAQGAIGAVTVSGPLDALPTTEAEARAWLQRWSLDAREVLLKVVPIATAPALGPAALPLIAAGHATDRILSSVEYGARKLNEAVPNLAREVGIDRIATVARSLNTTAQIGGVAVIAVALLLAVYLLKK